MRIHLPLVALIAATAATPLLGQSVSHGVPRRGPLVTGRDLTTLGAAALVAGALVPVDRRVARWSQRPAFHRNRAVRGAATAFRVLGDPGALAIGIATYGAGALGDRRGTAAVGLHGVGAVAAGTLVTGAIKAAVGRARPYATGDSLPTSFGLMRGLTQGTAYQSLPSGHATAAFALAGVLAAEGRHRWGETNRVTGPAGFAVAALVAGSRVYHDRHWASDVVLGAGIGATAGAVVARYTRGHPSNQADRRLLPRTTVPHPLVSWTVRF